MAVSVVEFVGVVITADLVDGNSEVARYSKSESVMTVSALWLTRDDGLYTINVKKFNVNLVDTQRMEFWFDNRPTIKNNQTCPSDHAQLTCYENVSSDVKVAAIQRKCWKLLVWMTKLSKMT